MSAQTTEYDEHAHPPSMILFGGIFYLIIPVYLMLIMVEQRCIALLERYEKEGHAMNARIVRLVEVFDNDYRNCRCCYSPLVLIRKAKHMLCMCDDVRGMMRTRAVVEYHPFDVMEQDHHNNNNKKKKKHHNKFMVVQKTIYLSKEEELLAQSEGTIPLYVLPGIPKSGYPQKQVAQTLKRRQLLLCFSIGNTILFALCYLLAVLEFIGGLRTEQEKKQAWLYVLANMIWTFPISYLFGKWIERKRFQEWIEGGHIVPTNATAYQTAMLMKETKELDDDYHEEDEFAALMRMEAGSTTASTSHPLPTTMVSRACAQPGALVSRACRVIAVDWSQSTSRTFVVSLWNKGQKTPHKKDEQEKKSSSSPLPPSSKKSPKKNLRQRIENV